MKQLIITFIIIVAISVQGFGQLRWDIFGGASLPSSPHSAGVLVNRQSPAEEFMFNINKLDPQYFIGSKLHMELGEPFFTELGLTYTKKSSTYHVEYSIIDTEHPVKDHFLKESDHLIMMPVNIGVNMGAVDFTSGFRIMTLIDKSTELDRLSGFTTESNAIQLGWQAGAGFYLGRTRLGAEYQSNFSRVGRGMFVNGQSLEIMNVPGQFVFTLQQSF
jgi:hypothetical protein